LTSLGEHGLHDGCRIVPQQAFELPHDAALRGIPSEYQTGD